MNAYVAWVNKFVRRRKFLVIIGGGFAGLNCARELASQHADVRVTVIDKNNYQLFQPLRYQMATPIPVAR
jgi:NADH dehydrogenase